MAVVKRPSSQEILNELHAACPSTRYRVEVRGEAEWSLHAEKGHYCNAVKAARAYAEKHPGHNGVRIVFPVTIYEITRRNAHWTIGEEN